LTIKVGCCGFAASQKKYFATLPVVEINRTFYEYLKDSLLAGWRRRAPEGFEFTVKAHQDLTHRLRLRYGREAEEALRKVHHECDILKARVLLFQTPGSFRFNDLSTAVDFFERADRAGRIFVWETRGSSWETDEARRALAERLAELDIPHVVDPLRLEPAYTGEKVAYFRLHGLGKRMYYYEHTDEELERVAAVARKYEDRVETVYVFFNNLAMFNDAVRFKTYLEEGEFPPLYDEPGLASVRKLLSRARFPATKSELDKRYGWRLVLLDDGTQVRFGEILSRLPRGSRFTNLDEVLDAVSKVLKG